MKTFRILLAFCSLITIVGAFSSCKKKAHCTDPNTGVPYIYTQTSSQTAAQFDAYIEYLKSTGWTCTD